MGGSGGVVELSLGSSDERALVPHRTGQDAFAADIDGHLVLELGFALEDPLARALQPDEAVGGRGDADGAAAIVGVSHRQDAGRDERSGAPGRRAGAATRRPRVAHGRLGGELGRADETELGESAGPHHDDAEVAQHGREWSISRSRAGRRHRIGAVPGAEARDGGVVLDEQWDTGEGPRAGAIGLSPSPFEVPRGNGIERRRGFGSGDHRVDQLDRGGCARAHQLSQRHGVVAGEDIVREGADGCRPLTIGGWHGASRTGRFG